MIKSPLRYPGGKSRTIKTLKNLIPDNYNEYRELFVGGGSMFLYEKQAKPSKEFWINDLHEPLSNFWLEMRDNPTQVIQMVWEYKEMFSNGRNLFNFLKENYDSLNTINKAAAFFAFNRITFSGTTDSGGYSDESFHKRFTQSSIERLEKIVPLMRNIKITNRDYKEIINTSGENVFLFLDPPYYSAKKSGLYGKRGNLHKDFNHEEFAQIIKDCKHKYLITYDDSEYIRNLFSFTNIIPWSFSYGMRNTGKVSNQKGHELLITNYIDKNYTLP